MKLAHFYDHNYFISNDNIYSSGAFNQDSWTRYLNHFEKLTIVANSSNHQVDLSTLNKVNHPNVTFEFVDNYRKIKNYIHGFIFQSKRLKNIIENHDAIAVRLPSELGYIVVNLARKLNKPYAIEVVGCPWDSYWNHGKLTGKLIAPISFLRMRNALKYSRFAIYVTQNFLQKRYPSTFSKRYFASNVDIPKFDSKYLLKERRKKILNVEGILKIGIIGALDVRYKGHKEALFALKKIHKQLPHYKLQIVGPGDGTWIRNLAYELGVHENLEIIGKLRSGKQIFDFLKNLDIYLHPSKQEGLPRSLIEAMSCGIPSLASSIAGIPELLNDEFLHIPGDFEKLSQDILNIHNDSAKLMNMVVENLNTAQNYTSDKLKAKRYEFWYDFSKHAE